MADLSNLSGYGSPLMTGAPRSALVQALMSGGGTMAPQNHTSLAGLGADDLISAMQKNPVLMNNLSKWFNTPSNTIPGTGTGVLGMGAGMPYAQGAAPGPNQIIPT